MGSAVLIGHNFAVTAGHVLRSLDQFLDDNPPRKIHGPWWPSLLALVQVGPDGKTEACRWDIKAIRSYGFTDLGLIYMELAEGQKTRVAFPTIGITEQQILAKQVSYIGFNRTEISAERNADGELARRYDLHVSTGQVKQVHHYERDSYIIDFPSFETNAYAGPGMSGGGVFYNGILVGIISTGASLEPGDEPLSHFATLWPMYHMNLVPHPNMDEFDLKFHDLIEMGVVLVDHEQLWISMGPEKPSFLNMPPGNKFIPVTPAERSEYDLAVKEGRQPKSRKGFLRTTRLKKPKQ